MGVIRGRMVGNSETIISVQSEGRFVEIPADAVATLRETGDGVELTLVRDAQILVRGSAPTEPGLISSEVFARIPIQGLDDVGGDEHNCNCNCNCGGGTSNCNCNCNCGAISTPETQLITNTVFRRAGPAIWGTDATRD